MASHYFGVIYDDLAFADRLENLSMGFTPPENIVKLAKELGLKAELIEGATADDLLTSLNSGAIIFVTWWDEDAGHYSLVCDVDTETDTVTLMDPLAARNGTYNTLALTEFLLFWRMRGAKLIVTYEPQ